MPSQYLKLNDPNFALKTAAQMVYGKLMNFYFLLKRRGSDYQVQDLKDTALRIRSMAAHALAVDNMDKLRGVEGLATRVYFSSFKHLIRQEEFFFNGRNRRPPKDPVNAMLSFIYTLLTNEVQSAVSICGLDPYFGALHEIDYGRPSLACDLVEEYRAFLGDRMVLGLINRKAVAASDFIIRETTVKTYVDEQDMREKRPVEMKPAAVRAFIASYEEMMKRQIYYPSLDKKVNYRWLIINQVRRFGESLEDGKGLYQPFLWQN